MIVKRIFIIAEAGVNHNGNLGIAKKMIKAAKSAGADAVKFQTFTAEAVISKMAPKAEYQKRTTGKGGSQLEMAKKFELPASAFKKLARYCSRLGILFLSSPFDLDSIDLLRDMGLDIFKIPSGEITNLPYLKKIGRIDKKIILSTGMASMGEIKDAIEVLVRAGTKKKNITVLHCTTAYPAAFEDINLLAMPAIRDALSVKVGYSDHTLGIEAAIVAAALGASTIEKHFTLNKEMKGPDHSASLEPREFKKMVGMIRNVEKALGDGLKKPSCIEIKNRNAIRKSIVAAKNIKHGEHFNESNITTKRPGTGISPMEWNNIIEKVAKKDYEKDEIISL